MANNRSGMELEGMRELLAQLEAMGMAMTETVMDKALDAGAEVVKEKVESHPNTPRSSGGGRHGKDNFVIKKNSDGTYDIGVTDEFFYLYFHEVGAKSGSYTINGISLETPSIPAKPFLRPSFENSIEEIEAAMIRIIKRELGLE